MAADMAGGAAVYTDPNVPGTGSTVMTYNHWTVGH
jgi:hypothetical protein